ncbi:MAG: sulfatase-like hydrolase/transferase [Bacteroidota bacterium]
MFPTRNVLILAVSWIFTWQPLPFHAQAPSPNILFIIADDWSYPHASKYGDSVVQTPNFDRVAEEGILFENAYVSSPSCTPSRAAILTGQHFWRLEVGANLYGPLPAEIPVFTDLLEQAGYAVGFTRKGWGPGEPEGRGRNPAGDRFENFEHFLSKKPSNSPFCFWFGSYEPHRGYKPGSGQEAGISLDKIEVPSCFPSNEIIRRDIADYYLEVQQFDQQIGELLAQLEAVGELDQTLIVVTSDNGMPFPRCKSNLYDLGTRMPLAIRWGNQENRVKTVSEFISLTDLAPTFLEIAGLPVPEQMTGRSLMPLLVGEEEWGQAARDFILFGKERHLPIQEEGDLNGYPMRALRTQDYLYIRNFRPQTWPAGTPNYTRSTFFPSYYADVDGGPTRSYMLGQREKDPLHERLFSLAFGKREGEELYDLAKDPQQLFNLASDPAYQKVRKELANKLEEALRRSSDPRIIGGEEVFTSYPYTGGTIYPDAFKRFGRRYATVKIEEFPSIYIGHRSIEILTPTHITYGEEFPVIYMFDGQNLFHAFEGFEGKMNKGWRVQHVIDSLSESGEIPNAIIVGIDNNGPNRFSEYMPAKPEAGLAIMTKDNTAWEAQVLRENPPTSDSLLKFLVQELKPFIDSSFPANPKPSHTFLAGSSMGGLIAAYGVGEYPEVFGGAACLSTHWVPLDGVFLSYIEENLPDPATHKLYFDYGTEGLDNLYESYQNVADDFLKKHGYEPEKNWITKKFEGAKHHEDDWHARLHFPLTFLLEGLK